MNVAHVLRKYDPREWGGTETAVLHLLGGLRGQGVASATYCPRLSGVVVEDPMAEAGNRIVRFDAFVPIARLTCEQRRRLIAIGGNLMSLDLIPRLLLEPGLSLIHTHTLGRLGGIARTVARWRSIPLVITIHGGVLDLPKETEEQLRAMRRGGWEWGKVFGFFLGSRTLLADADAIFTVNSREAELLKERYPGQHIEILPHGIPVERYATDRRGAALAAFPWMQGKQVVLVPGRIDRTKNQGWLVQQCVKILADHPEALVVSVGAATDLDYEKQMRSLAQELGISERVSWIGGLSPSDPRLIGLFQAASVVALPSVSETFGLVILEAWAAGTPVIASSTSGARQLIVPGENGWLFDLANPGTFHDALRAVLSNPSEAARTVHVGRRRVREEYNEVIVAAHVKELYESLVVKKRK